VFDLWEGDNRDSHAGEYVLPRGDLDKCWMIMEAGVSASSHELLDHSLPNLIRMFMTGIVYAVLATNAIYLAFNRFMRIAAMSDKICSSENDLIDRTTMQNVLCTNGNYAGSVCVAKCLQGYGEGADGIVRAATTVCREGRWHPEKELFLKACMMAPDTQEIEVFT